MKPTILVFARYYLPGFRAGGPIRSVSNVVGRLSHLFDFKIVALDRDAGAPEAYKCVSDKKWIRVGDAEVCYVRPGCGLQKMRAIIHSTPHDLLYLNSFFDPRFTLLPMLINRFRSTTRPVVIAPRGELSNGALGLRGLRKVMFLRAVNSSGFFDGLTWQASNEQEAADIERALARVLVSGQIAIAPDMVEQSQAGMPLGPMRNKEHSLRICFLSRISPMKNLKYALEVLAKSSVPVRLAIYGPTEDADYWKRCRALMDTMPGHVQIEYAGVVGPEDVIRTIAEHDLFFLPTLGENYGHVIHESLRAGVPVLISDLTPWLQLTGRGAGWALPLNDPSAFLRVIEQVAGWSDEERRSHSMNARQLAADVAHDPAILEANKRLFLNAIGASVERRQ